MKAIHEDKSPSNASDGANTAIIHTFVHGQPKHSDSDGVTESKPKATSLGGRKATGPRTQQGKERSMLVAE